MPKMIDCPECWGGTRRPPGPCPTCGDRCRIARGGNGIPRGCGDHGSQSPQMLVRVAERKNWEWHRLDGRDRERPTWAR